MLSNRTLAKIYRQAAEDIFIRNQYSCCAVWDLIEDMTKNPSTIENSNTAKTDIYRELFKEEGESNNVFWINNKTNILPEELQEFRIMALLFMAAMLEFGDI